MAGSTKPERDAAAVRVFPPAVPLLTMIAGILADAVVPLEAGRLAPAAARYAVGGAIVAGSIVGLGAWSVLTVRRTGQSENPYKPTTQLLDAGPFRLTRNPMYLQMVLVCVGVAIMLGNAWILIFTPACAWALHRFAILPEEAYLAAKFGDAYRAYCARVRRWL